MAKRDGQILKSVLHMTPECLSTHELEQFETLAPGDPAGIRLRSHLADCPRCRTELALFSEFIDGQVRSEETKDVAWITARLKDHASALHQPLAREKKSWWQGFLESVSWRPAAAFAFGVLLVVIAGDFYLRRGAPPLATDVETGVVRSGSLAAISPTGELAAGPLLFHWEPVPGASSYRVSVLEVDRHEVWSSSTAGAQTELSAGPALSLRPGAWYLWKIVALDSGGRQVAESGLIRFRPNLPSPRLRGN